MMETVRFRIWQFFNSPFHDPVTLGMLDLVEMHMFAGQQLQFFEARKRLEARLLNQVPEKYHKFYELGSR